MTTAKSTSIQERDSIYPILVQDLMKMGVCRWGGDGLNCTLQAYPLYDIHLILKLPKLFIHGFIISCYFESIALNQW